MKQHMPVTGLSLLEAVQPTLAVYYKKAFAEYAKDDNQPQKALARFAEVTKGLYEITHRGHVAKMPSIHAISQSLQLKVDVKVEVAIKIYRGEQLSPIQAKQQLHALKNQSKEVLLLTLLGGGRDSQEAFQSLCRRQQLVLIKAVSEKLQQENQAYSLTAQQNILKAMTGIPFHSLILMPFRSALTDDLLIALLQGAASHLLKLDLTDCHLITPKILTTLPKACAHLHVFIAKNTFQQPDKSFVGANQGSLEGDYIQLHQLILDNCPEIKKVALQAPNLNEITITQCKELKGIQIHYTNLLKNVSLQARLLQELANPKGPNYYYTLANSRELHGRYKEVIDDYTQAIILEPKYAVAFHNRGVARASLGHYQAAIDDFDQAIVLDPKYAGAFLNRGIARANLGHYQAAIDDYNQAIALDPNAQYTFTNRAIVAFKMKDYQTAITDFKQGLSTDTNSILPIYYLVRCYAGGLGVEKDKIIADTYYQQAFDAALTGKYKDNEWSWYYLGRLYHRGLSVEKDTIKAKMYYQKVLDTPSSMFYWRNKSQKRLQALAVENDNNVSTELVPGLSSLKN